MGIDTRQAPLTAAQQEFGNVLDYVALNCADAGVKLDVDLRLALSQKGAAHRIEILNAIFAVRNLTLQEQGYQLLPTLDPQNTDGIVLAREIRLFQNFVRQQIVAAGWAPADTLLPPNNRDVLDDLQRDFNDAGIGLQINRGLLKGSTHESGVYRVRMMDALRQLNRRQVAQAMGSEFAAAVADRTVIWQRSDATEHPVYQDPDLMMAMIRDRGSGAQGNATYTGKTHG